MIRRRRLISTAIAALCSATLVLTSCGAPENGTTSGGNDAPVGDPVAGGTLQAIQGREPLSLDPSDISNVWTHSPLLGNALYGTLITNNVETQEIEYSMATDFSTADGGQTFTLELQPGLQFTDGTPLDAAAVEYNWDRLRDPSKGSASLRQAEQIADVEAVDADTLNVTLVSPNPTFPNSLLVSALNWIASPTALEKGREAFDKNPVGAGPFTLTEWARQDVIQLVKNPEYWDAPRPYLDGITLRTVPAADQRLNTLSTGSADLASESNWLNLSKSESLGLDTEIVPMGGGQYFAMNTRRAPFDDERARRAVNLAADMEGVNLVAFEGNGVVPQTLFPEGSPFYEDISLQESDAEEAQRLFDELAADGKPLSFTFTTYSLTEARAAAETLQAQLSAFDNVEVKVETLDFAAAQTRVNSRDFDMTISSANIQDPDGPLWSAFHSSSQGNTSGIDDGRLDAALEAGRVGITTEERKAAYYDVQRRLTELVPGVWFIQSPPATITGADTHGVRLYGMGSPLPDGVWISE
ncbi:ABC transporter substrate-binding protein [Rhodococcus artemisiae]|uniref:ABC transporter substrate-binding protein n=1 Tax=Rhodococcus artemisiae TaxID=714159 RepID=A0ABU7L8A8_9NOCA|nr:ABC transporter substrate-binding protein [Rhodococcus artemisiae]MEE2057783.1 ABC transporter substrate-binding protein [Rhodococcus artemisiae]